MKKLLYLFLAAAFVSACSNDEPVTENKPEVPGVQEPMNTEITLTNEESRAVEQIRGFDLKFFQAVNAKADASKNVVCSPLSASILLSMLANIAEDTAADELVAVLGCTDLDALNSLSKKYIDILPVMDSATKFSMANALWYERQYTLNPKFTAVASEFFGTESFSADLRDNAPAVIAQINKWGSDKTEGLIDKIIKYLPDECVAVLANTLYFKGSWANPFDAKETTTKEFFGASRTSIVNMMHKRGYQHCAECADYSAVKMEFGNGSYEAMLVLPAEGTDIDAFIAGDALATLSTVRFSDYAVDFSYPKFKIGPDDDFDLEQSLRQIGVNELWKGFTPSFFTVPMNLKHQIQQKATIEFSEEGAEGAAVTWDVMVDSAGPGSKPSVQQINFNRPFVFMINQTTTGVTLFAGKVIDL